MPIALYEQAKEEKEDKNEFVNGYEVINNQKGLSVSEKELILKEKRTLEESLIKKVSLYNKGLLLNEIILDYKIDVSFLSILSNKILKNQNKSLKRKNKE